MPHKVYTPGSRIGTCIFLREDGIFIDARRKHKIGVFVCQCGKEFRERITLVNTGKKTSCGCGITRHAKRRQYTEIGTDCNSTEYVIWINIKARCFNAGHPSFHNYGGRGVSMCEKWKNSFSDFIKDVGSRPSLHHSLDRYPDKNGNYEPGNIRWATPKEQGRNRRDNVIISHHGQTMCVSEWAEKLGLTDSLINDRLKLGYSPEKALFVGRYNSHGHPIYKLKLQVSF